MSNWLKREEGSGLILSIMTLMVLFVLGLSIGTITISGHRMSHANRDSISAYYIAEAGANLAYEDMKSIVEEIYHPGINQDTFFGAIEEKFQEEITSYEEFETQFGHKPKVEIKIGPPEENDKTRVYTIESVSKIDKHFRTAQKEVTVNWIGTENGGSNLPSLPESVSLIANSSISFTNGQIIGDIYLNTLEKDSFLISNSGTVSSNTSKILVPGSPYKQIYKTTGGNPPLQNFINRTVPEKPIQWQGFENVIESFPYFPNYPDDSSYSQLPNDSVSDSGGHNTHWIVKDGSIYHNSWIKDRHPILLSSNTKIKNVEVASDKDLVIETGNRDLTIILDNIDIQHGSLTFKGTGHLTIYVTNSLTVNGKHNKDALVFQDYQNVNLFAQDYHHSGGQSRSINTDLVSLYIKNNISFGWGTINSKGNSNAFLIYHQGDQMIDFGGSITINASMFFMQSLLKISSGVSINGPVITGGNKVELSGGAKSSPLIIAPYSDVILSGGGTLKGIIVSNRISLSGGTVLEYLPYDMSKFPFGSSVPSNRPNPSIDDLINAEPTKEPR